MLDVRENIDGIAHAAVDYFGIAGRVAPRDDIFEVIVVGNGLVGALIDADRNAAGSLAMLYALSKEMTARRWGDGVTLMSSVLWSAWDEAGRPELPGFTKGCSRAAPVQRLEMRGFPPGLQTGDAGTDVDAGVDGGVFDAGTVVDVDGGRADVGSSALPHSPGCGCASGGASWLTLCVIPWTRKRRER